MEKIKKSGGARIGAGRKPKIDEISLIESMDAIAVPEKLWRALLKKAEEGDTNAIKTWLQYRYGMPKQVIDQNINIEKPIFNSLDLDVPTDNGTE